METICIDNIWYFRDGQRLFHIDNIVRSTLYPIVPDHGYHFDYLRVESRNGKVVEVKINSHGTKPTFTIIPGRLSNAQDKDLFSAFITSLSALISCDNVLLSTDSSGNCPFCGKHLNQLFPHLANDELPLTVTCCGYCFSLEESLENIADGFGGVIIKDNYIITSSSSNFAAIVQILPQKIDSIFVMDRIKIP